MKIWVEAVNSAWNGVPDHLSILTHTVVPSVGTSIGISFHWDAIAIEIEQFKKKGVREPQPNAPQKSGSNNHFSSDLPRYFASIGVNNTGTKSDFLPFDKGAEFRNVCRGDIGG